MANETLFELYKTVNGKEYALGRDRDETAVNVSLAVMQAHAQDGVSYGVREVEMVTRPFREVESS